MQHVDSLPNVFDWGLDSIDKLEKDISTGLKAALAEVIHYAMQEDDTYIYFPAVFIRNNNYPDADFEKSDGVRRGHEVEDPLTVYLRVAATYAGDEQPTYSFNLRDSLQNDIDSCKEDGSYGYGLAKLASALRELADDIDSAVATGNSTPAA